VAGGEDQAQQVVADVVLARGIQRMVEVGHDQTRRIRELSTR
jgi:hypothetical protein